MNIRGGLLASTLGSSTVKDAGRLAGQFLTAPEPTSGIKECLHLSGHHAKPCGETENDAICLRQLTRGDGWHLSFRRSPHLPQNLSWQCLWHLFFRNRRSLVNFTFLFCSCISGFCCCLANIILCCSYVLFLCHICLLQYLNFLGISGFKFVLCRNTQKKLYWSQSISPVPFLFGTRKSDNLYLEQLGLNSFNRRSSFLYFLCQLRYMSVHGIIPKGKSTDMNSS